MKKIMLIATGGTIASGYTEEGLAPRFKAEELLEYVEEYREFCSVEVLQPFNLDSTNVCGKHWLELAAIIREHYEDFDGFVICHGTDTMAFTAAALSYLVQNSSRPIVVTGSQKPINLPVTDARTNLLDSLRFARSRRPTASILSLAAMSLPVPGPRRSAPRAIMPFPALIILPWR